MSLREDKKKVQTYMLPVILSKWQHGSNRPNPALRGNPTHWHSTGVPSAPLVVLYCVLTLN